MDEKFHYILFGSGYKPWDCPIFDTTLLVFSTVKQAQNQKPNEMIKP